jgi:tetratricopeptide (TPR) repeat protein
MINDAIQQLQAEHADSAEALAKRSLVLNRTSPYGFMVLGNVAQKRNQPRQAIDYYRQTVTAAGADTSYADVKRQILLAAGNMAAEASEAANGSEKSAYDTDAKWAFEALLADAKDPKADPKAASYADAARSGLARLASASGDTASVRATYAEQLANPSGFTFQQLLSSGVTAARAKQTPDAIKLFEAAYKKNPYHRDVLYNLALMYLNGNQTEKVVPMVRELVAVDPSNGDNFRLFTFAFANIQKTHNEQIKKYNELKKNAKTPRAQKAYDDSARTFFELAKPMTDSALKYNAMADAFPMKVTFSEFTSADDKTTLGGAIANNTDQSQTYTLKVDFLDMSGKVITSQTATVGPVAGGQSGRFSVQGAGAGISGFKYAPLVDPNTIKPKSH